MNDSQSTPPASLRVLASTIAGSWHPGTAEALDAFIEGCLAKTSKRPEPTPNILILPHAGYVYSGQTAAHGIRQILDAPFKRVVLLAPTHRAAISNCLVAPEAGAVSTPYGRLEIDRDAIHQVAGGMDLKCSDAIHAHEHATQIQYPLLQYALKGFKIAPFIVGQMDPFAAHRAAAALRAVVDDETLVVVSSDFTHYGRDFDYAPYPPGEALERVKQVDFEAFDHIRAGDAAGFTACIDASGATICGREPIRVLLDMLPPNTAWERLHYATSSDDSGDDSRFVCYLSAAGRADWGKPHQKAAEDKKAAGDTFLTTDEKRTLLRIARKSIEHVFETGKPPVADRFADEATENLRRPSGCFVTLNTKPSGSLRGCIGEIVAQRPLYQAVAALAVHSAFGDRRFRPLQASELDGIEIEISVLTPERPVDSWRDIVIGRHGMTVSKRGRMAVFLPQVAPEQGWTLEETLTQLSLKAGLRADDWRDGAQFTVFEAIVFGEG
ncbi:MAG: AmmeMemoRadiSam system protein B [Kiritimatiellia bacterium]|jgi:AmmeMemoRadiSam system protein B/AmmeMemoRadiSam system protein A